jgi:hypothetical protein
MPYRVAFRGSAGLWALSGRFETAGEAERYLAALPAGQKRLITVRTGRPGRGAVRTEAPRGGAALVPGPGRPPALEWRAGGQAPTAPAAPSAPAGRQALFDLLLAGLTPDELSRLADLRVRARRGAVGGADDGRAPETRLDGRRLAFALWLVQTGRLHDR